MKVKEIMKKDVISIAPEENALTALTILFSKKISGLPVIDSEGKLSGMFTEKDLLTYILPSYVGNVGRFVYEENPKTVKKKFLELSNMKVSNIMRKDVVTANEDATLCEVAKDMLTRHSRRVPIIDSSGKVVGIVARGDIVEALAGEAEIRLAL